MGAKQVDLELPPQYVASQIFDRPWLSIGGIVEECVDVASAAPEYITDGSGNRITRTEFELDRLDPL